MKAKYGNRAQLLFTDTDSLMYEIETPDVYADIVESRHLYDLSNYEASHRIYKPDFSNNKAQVGLMKDEVGGSIITEFVGLRPKMYSFQAAKIGADGSLSYYDKHRAKGIQRVVAAKFTHEEYKRQLEFPAENYVVNRRLGSRLHEIYGIEVW